MNHEIRPASHQVERLPSLTGIRGIAAIWVVMFHIMCMGAKIDVAIKVPFAAVWWSGWSGVDLFFVLSGFMLMHVHATQFQTLNWQACKEFGFVRFFRVFPLSLAALFMVLVLVLADRGFAAWYEQAFEGGLTLETFLSTLALATAWYPHPSPWNIPVWSLSAEVIGYLFFPLIAWSANRLQGFWTCIALAVLCCIAVLVQQQLSGELGSINNIHPPGALVRMGGFFAAGVLLKRAALVRPSLRGLQALALVSVAAIAVLTRVPLGASFMPLAFGALIYALSDQRGPVAWVLSTRIAMFFGAISFPLYLLHIMPFWAFHYHVAQGLLPRWAYEPSLALLVAAMCGLSWLAHKGIEQPCHRFARRFVARRAAPAVRQTVPA